ncbi:MAG: penicillin-insensitive murein endopeptidase, partial [Deltaproteobacteria bacterium]|nr:penicillin-insensitive murein endopeptidase [Deltaproteobacteria bacterium]
INYEIQKLLYEHLEKRKFKRAYLDRLFQYPRGRGAEAVIRHVKGHHHHMHIRFVCPSGDGRCTD